MFTIKATADELTRWKELAGRYDLPLAEVIRLLMEGVELRPDLPPPKPKHRPPPKVDPYLIRQVAAIGNNLNQIARRVNAGQRFDVLASLASIEDRLAELIELAKEGRLK